MEKPSIFINLKSAEINFEKFKYPPQILINNRADTKITIKNIVKGNKKEYGVKSDKEIFIQKIKDSIKYRTSLLFKSNH